ncbi:MAG: sigma-54 dependent transcriptional regulator [Desulfobacterales bacterium]
MNNILVVDDDRNILNVIQMRLESESYRVLKALNSNQALTFLGDNDIDLALVDLRLKDEDGITLMEDIHRANPDLPIIILTAHGSINSAVEAMKRGAANYLTKPFNYQELLLQIQNCLEKSELSKEVNTLRNICAVQFGFKNIIGRSEGMKRVLEQVAQAAETDSNVHIEGESGTGKELIAKSLHLSGPRKKGPFVAINCAAIPETLLESELFGYKKGAFSGAVSDKKGLFVQAHNGSFFLDEISEMPLSMQSKLLRVLEEREFFPVGGQQTIRVDTRIITASNKNLEQEVENKNFREDLYYRIHVIRIQLPPLRDRRDDIPLLAKHFLKKYATEMKKEITGFSSAALQKLLRYHWPGNVRELENTIESAVAMGAGNEIGAELILPKCEADNECIKPLKEAKDDFMKNYLLQLVEFTQGNVSQAAKLAGKYRADLYELMKRYKLDPSNFRE